MTDRPATTSKKKPGRKRLAAGWLLLVIGVLITGVWGASRWWWPSMLWGTCGVEVSQGGVCVVDLTTRVSSRPHWTLYVPAEEDRRWKWTFGYYWSADGWQLWLATYMVANSGPVVSPGRYWNFLLWPFALASLLGGGWLVWSGRRARRRAMTGLCLKCGYDLSGLGAGAPCPECGTEAIAPR